MRIFVCKLRLHFPDGKHLRGFVGYAMKYFSSLGNFWPTPPLPQLYMLATALETRDDGNQYNESMKRNKYLITKVPGEFQT
jgi:hypothetical protein